MKLLYDLRFVSKTTFSKFHGGNEYSNAVVLRLLTVLHEYSSSVVFILKPGQEVDPCIGCRISENPFASLIYLKTPLDDLILSEKINVYYNPLGGGAEISDVSVKQVFTIHGLRYVECITDVNEYFVGSKIKYFVKKFFTSLHLKNKIGVLRKSLKLNFQNKVIICPSNHTKFALVNFLGVDSSMIRVLYSPLKNNASEIIDEESFLRKCGIERNRYYLSVSMNRWYKNPLRLLQAYSDIKQMQLANDHKLVLVGISKKLKAMFSSVESIIWLDFVSTVELEVLYKNAFVHVYPTLNEGFGYPPVEAMKYGKVSLASAVNSITEVLGESAIYFNPYDTEEIKNRLLMVTNDEMLRHEKENICIQKHPLIQKKQNDDLDELIRLLLL